MKNDKLIYTLSLLLIFTSLCQAQFKTDDPKGNNINSEPSAESSFFGPSSITRNIKQDKNGNIWLASWEGIFKFDGKSFTNITSGESLSHFFSILVDKKGNFWFGSIGSGVYYYNGESFENFTTKEGLANDSVIDIFEAKNGDIWFSTQGGASYYDGTSIHSFTSEDGLPNNDINSIIKDRTGTFWFASRGELSTYDGKTFTNFTQEDGQAFMNVRSIIEDSKGHIWLGGQEGLWRFDGSSITNITTAFVGFIYEDSKGSLWTSSETINKQGWEVTRYDKNLLFPEKLTATPILKDQGMIFGILVDNKSGVWFGTLNGVCHYNESVLNCFNDKIP